MSFEKTEEAHSVPQPAAGSHRLKKTRGCDNVRLSVLFTLTFMIDWFCLFDFEVLVHKVD